MKSKSIVMICTALAASYGQAAEFSIAAGTNPTPIIWNGAKPFSEPISTPSRKVLLSIEQKEIAGKSHLAITDNTIELVTVTSGEGDKKQTAQLPKMVGEAFTVNCDLDVGQVCAIGPESGPLEYSIKRLK